VQGNISRINMVYKLTCPNCGAERAVDTSKWTAVHAFIKIVCPTCKHTIEKKSNPNYKKENATEAHPVVKPEIKTPVIGWLVCKPSMKICKIETGKNNILLRRSDDEITVVNTRENYNNEVNIVINAGTENANQPVFLLQKGISNLAIRYNERLLQGEEEYYLNDTDEIIVGETVLLFASEKIVRHESELIEWINRYRSERSQPAVQPVFPQKESKGEETPMPVSVAAEAMIEPKKRTKKRWIILKILGFFLGGLLVSIWIDEGYRELVRNIFRKFNTPGDWPDYRSPPLFTLSESDPDYGRIGNDHFLLPDGAVILWCGVLFVIAYLVLRTRRAVSRLIHSFILIGLFFITTLLTIMINAPSRNYTESLLTDLDKQNTYDTLGYTSYFVISAIVCLGYLVLIRVAWKEKKPIINL